MHTHKHTPIYIHIHYTNKHACAHIACSYAIHVYCNDATYIPALCLMSQTHASSSMTSSQSPIKYHARINRPIGVVTPKARITPSQTGVAAYTISLCSTRETVYTSLFA